METIAHRELRNSSAEVLRRVERGESLLISNKGVVVARIVPVSHNSLDSLIERGEAKPPSAPISTLSDIARPTSTRTIKEILADARGTW